VYLLRMHAPGAVSCLCSLGLSLSMAASSTLRAMSCLCNLGVSIIVWLLRARSRFGLGLCVSSYYCLCVWEWECRA